MGAVPVIHVRYCVLTLCLGCEIMASKKLEALVEEIGGLSMMEVADLVKALETKFGVSAAAVAPSASAPAASAAEAPKEEEKTHYKVTLKESGAKKMDVIKAVRQVIPTLGLIEAKKAVEEAPFVLAESAAKDDAKKMKEVIEAAGAKVELA